MMGWRIGRTTLNNFGPFEFAEVDFSEPGLTLIEGVIHDRPGCNSNGAGKSFLYDAPAWAIFGRCIREEYKGDEVIRNGAKGASVTTRIQFDTREIVITRYRGDKHNGNEVHVFIDGENHTRGTTPVTNQFIEDVLQINYQTFIGTVAFGVREDVKSFFFATDTDRKALINHLLGLDDFSTAEKLARLRLRDVTSTMTRLQSKMDCDRAALDALNESDSSDGLASMIARHEADLVQETRTLDAQSAELKTLAKAASTAKAAHAKAAKDYDKKYAAYSKAYDTVDAKIAALNEDYVRSVSEVSKAKTRKSSLESMRDNIERLGEGECPTCTAPVTAKSKSATIKKIKEDLEPLLDEVTRCQAESQKIKDAIAAITHPEAPDDTELDEADAEMQRCDQAVFALEAERDRTRKTIERLTDTLSRAKSDSKSTKTAAKKKELQVSIKAAEKESAALQSQISVFEFWMEGFGTKGIQSFLIENAIPEINRVASYYAARLLGDGAFIRMEATRQLKSRNATKEELTIHAGIPGCADSYAGASKGQRKRLHLSLLLAFQKTMTMRRSCPVDQFFADEIFDGMDQAGSENVVQLLHEIAEACPVSMISHDPRIKGSEDRTVTVEHRDGVATIAADRSATTKTVSVKKPGSVKKPRQAVKKPKGV